MYPFQIKAFFEATDVRLSTDSAVDTQPTRTVGYTNYDRGAAAFYYGIIRSIGIRLNPANAVTARLEIYQSDEGGDGTYFLRADCLFKSWDNNVTDVAACADDTEYWWIGVDKPFKLHDKGDFYFNIDWSAPPGDTTGFIVIEGERETT